MIKDVRISDFYIDAGGLKESHRRYPTGQPMRVFGADTETVRGSPYTFQIVSEGEEVIERIDEKTIFPRFMNWLRPRALDSGANYVFFHNLRFDLTILFCMERMEIYNQYNDIQLEKDGWKIKLFYGRVNMALLREDLGGYRCKICKVIPKEAVEIIDKRAYCGNKPAHPDGRPRVRPRLGMTIHILDSAAFCPPGSKSLGAALKIYGVPYKKLPQPDGLGKELLWTDEFKQYALNDARAEEALGRSLLDVHKEYDIPPCVSLPQMAGKILRHHFFKKGEKLMYPPEDLRAYAELSYHAGKNGFYVKRGFYRDLYEYDINSAFPRAMRDLPQLVKGKYQRVKRYHSQYMGLYRISGRRLGGAYPIVFNHAFKPVTDTFSNLWITGYELEVLRDNPDYHFKINEGWIWKQDPAYPHSPLASFVDKFWTLKSTTPKGPKRDTYKNILNSLYGKFAACREDRPMVQTAFGPIKIDGYFYDEDKSGELTKHYIAGALYHPFIATQITGYVRRDLYRLEKAGRALHSATDSIKSARILPTSDRLGGIKIEVFGNCYLFRNKLYLHFARDNSLCGHDLKRGWLYVLRRDSDSLKEVGEKLETGKTWNEAEQIYRGKLFDENQHLCKYGLHGFKGSVFELYRSRQTLLERGEFTYQYDHMVALREGIKRGERVSDMVEREERLLLTP